MSGIIPELGALLQRLNAHDESREAMAEVFESLTPREKVVTCATFGLCSVRVLTADELAAIFGTSSARIVQLRQKALRKLSWKTRYPRLLEAEKLITAPQVDFLDGKGSTVCPVPEKLHHGPGNRQG
jgi:hypothetical protein